jgi:hypothetical protein
VSQQFVVQLANHPGEIAHLARALAGRGVDIRRVVCVGGGPLACLFLATDNEDETRRVLRGFGHEFIEGTPVLAEVEDRPGGLAEVTERLAAAGVNITGMLMAGRHPGLVEMAICVDDEKRAQEALKVA